MTITAITPSTRLADIGLDNAEMIGDELIHAGICGDDWAGAWAECLAADRGATVGDLRDRLTGRSPFSQFTMYVLRQADAEVSMSFAQWRRLAALVEEHGELIRCEIANHIAYLTFDGPDRTKIAVREDGETF